MSLGLVILLFTPIVILDVVDFFFMTYPQLKKMEESNPDERSNISWKINLMIMRLLVATAVLIFLILLFIFKGGSK